MSANRVEVFVVCTPGLEALTLAEVTRLGFHGPRARYGGVEATGTWPQVWAANLHLRTATRVLVRVARFRADTFSSLQASIRRIDWAAWLPADAALDVSAAATESALYHTDAIAARVLEAAPNGDGDPVDLYVRIASNVVTVSLNTSGDPLYRRGWRGPAGRAPLRETLAAALVMASEWDPRTPLVDPMCGSGTVAIEAARFARRIPPGRGRNFAFSAWPTFDAGRWQRLLDAADADVLARVPTVLASDRDEGAVAATLENAVRAGVEGSVECRRASVSDLTVPGRRGVVATNPPYGERLDGEGDLRDLYDRLGAVLRRQAPGWTVAVLAPPGAPVGGLGLERAEDRVRTANGGLPVRVHVGAVPDATSVTS